MCTGIEIALLVGGGLALAGAGIAGGMMLAGSDQPQLPAPVETPSIPDPNEAKLKAKEDARRRAALKTDTTLTSGVGVIEDANIKQKTLLGG